MIICFVGLKNRRKLNYVPVARMYVSPCLCFSLCFIINFIFKRKISINAKRKIGKQYKLFQSNNIKWPMCLWLWWRLKCQCVFVYYTFLKFNRFRLIGLSRCRFFRLFRYSHEKINGSCIIW